MAGNRTSCYNAGIVGQLCGSNYGSAILGVVGSDYHRTTGNCQWAGYFCGPTCVTGNLNTPHSCITDICTTNIHPIGATTETGIYVAANSCVQLYYDNGIKMKTYSTGIYVYGSVTCSSDCRIKENIQPITSAISKIENLCGVCFDFCNDKNKRIRLGLIAQEVEPIVPEIVQCTDPTKEEKEKYGINDKTYGVNYSGVVPLLIEAIKEQQQEINELKKIIKNQK